MRFILASISGRIQCKLRKKNLPRFAPPCDSFLIQSTVEFRANTQELLPRFARPNDILWVQSLLQFRANFASFCLASLGQAIYFCLNLRPNLELKLPRLARPCNLFWLPSTVEFRANIRKLLPRFARPCDLFWLHLRSNSEQHSKAYASLRSAMRFILAPIFCRIQSKHSRAPASLRLAMRFMWTSISPAEVRVKLKSFCLASLGATIYLSSIVARI